MNWTPRSTGSPRPGLALLALYNSPIYNIFRCCRRSAKQRLLQLKSLSTCQLHRVLRPPRPPSFSAGPPSPAAAASEGARVSSQPHIRQSPGGGNGEQRLFPVAPLLRYRLSASESRRHTLLGAWTPPGAWHRLSINPIRENFTVRSPSSLRSFAPETRSYQPFKPQRVDHLREISPSPEFLSVLLLVPEAYCPP